MAWIGDMFAKINPLEPLRAGLDIYGAQAADRANRKAVDKQWQRNMDADNTAIQRRVADAQKAGVHPLYALGVNPASGPAASVVPSEQGEAFRSVSRSIANRKTPEERAFEMVQLEEMKSRTALNFAHASAIASDQARLAQQSNTTAPKPDVTGVKPKGAVNIIPGQVTSMGDQAYLTAGVGPSMTEVNDPAGGTRFYPSKEMAEIVESIGELLAPLAVIPMVANAHINRATHRRFGQRLFKKNAMPRKKFEELYYGWPYRNTKRPYTGKRR